MANKSKIKGSTFEYKIRDIFTETFGKQFERVPLSGALSYLKGDIWSPYWPEIRWTIECKHHKEVDWNNILTAPASNLVMTFWDQAAREAAVMKKLPLLIYRWDNGKDYVCWVDEDINCQNQIIIDTEKRKFKMALLSDWLPLAKKLQN